MQKKVDAELEQALSQILDRIHNSLGRNPAYSGEPVKMYLAGGFAVNFYCGSRFTTDIDASFSRRILLPDDLTVSYQARTGESSFVYFDRNYSPLLALMHEDFEKDALEWPGIGNQERIVKLFVLSPVDLAVSKIARFSEDDGVDIRSLAVERLFTPDELKKRGEDAIAYYVGDPSKVRANLKYAVENIRTLCGVEVKKSNHGPKPSM